jgi:hypothetical protein
LVSDPGVLQASVIELAPNASLRREAARIGREFFHFGEAIESSEGACAYGELGCATFTPRGRYNCIWIARSEGAETVLFSLQSESPARAAAREAEEIVRGAQLTPGSIPEVAKYVFALARRFFEEQATVEPCAILFTPASQAVFVPVENTDPDGLAFLVEGIRLEASRLPAHTVAIVLWAEFQDQRAHSRRALAFHFEQPNDRRHFLMPLEDNVLGTAIQVPPRPAGPVFDFFAKPDVEVLRRERYLGVIRGGEES